ncbi:fringe glycosyltransferase-like [Photinus pyralis]|uniref:fringe glycosyltransferase-like n=1 Tax=Photinus pyralis TaxID=7054 RepID=UPI0012671305|nr:fringe glycosyltransferase-like [Photinus pyralis]XP_031358185.1 fringe glycosyltransferase-like [Photinus pyralis]
MGKSQILGNMFKLLIVIASCLAPLYILISHPNLKHEGRTFHFDFKIGSTISRPNHITLDDVYIAVKTSSSFHQTRLPMILQTWFPLANDQIWFFTDADDLVLQMITDRHMINTYCPPTHFRRDLSCKMGVEINTFMTTNKTWFCHFDDDNYVNIPNLIEMLKGYDPEADWYLGRNSYSTRYNATIIKRMETVNFWFATGGAGICISRPLGVKMLPYISGVKFLHTSDSILEPDDVTVGFIIEHLLNVSMTRIAEFHSHEEKLNLVKRDTIKEQVSFGYQNKNIIEIEGR